MAGHTYAHTHQPSKYFSWLTMERRLYGVIVIASCFLVAELIIGFTNHALVLVADAFHITSDLIGYCIAVMAIRLAKRKKSAPKGFSFGLKRAELLGAFLNGALLLGLGLSVILQSVERFINPSEIENPVLIIIIGAAGIGSNLFMLALLGGHAHSHGPEIVLEDLSSGGQHTHADHAHAARVAPKKGKRLPIDLNILGVLLHIAGDALNSLAVILSGVVFQQTGWVYADPIASLFVGFMIIGTALPLTLKAGRVLAEAAPRDIDMAGIEKDILAVPGVQDVHELHCWSLTQSKALAALHVTVTSDSLAAFMKLSQRIQSCLHFWGIHGVTIQPELELHSDSDVDADDTVTPAEPAEENGDDQASTCRLRCPSQLCEEACC